MRGQCLPSLLLLVALTCPSAAFLVPQLPSLGSSHAPSRVSCSQNQHPRRVCSPVGLSITSDRRHARSFSARPARREQRDVALGLSADVLSRLCATSQNFSVRAASPDEMTEGIAEEGRGELLGPVSRLCAQVLHDAEQLAASFDTFIRMVLYDAEHLAPSVVKDLQRRYGETRSNRGVVVVATQAEKSQGDRQDPTLVGVAGMEMVALLPNGGDAPILRSFFGPSSIDDAASEQRAREAFAPVLLRPLVSNVAVSTEHRRLGVASALMLTLEEAAGAMGFEEILLKVEESNDGAIRLYRSLGFTETEGGRFEETKFVALEAGAGGDALGRWVPTVNVVMRKSIARR